MKRKKKKKKKRQKERKKKDICVNEERTMGEESIAVLMRGAH